MTRHAVFAVPGDLATPTGGYVYDRRMVAHLRANDWKVDVIDLGDGFPHVSEAGRHVAEDRLARASTHGPVVVDGLALGVLPEAAATLSGTHKLVALVHHPLALETGLSDVQRMSLLASERRALSRVRHIITTSETTKSILLSDFGVAADWVSVVRPGVERVTCPVRREGKNVSLLAVGSIVPRKGYDVLIAALAMLKDLPWHLMIVGDRMRDTTTAARIDDLVREHALADRIVMTGAVPNERLATLYMNADVFVLPSRYEGYGMAFADAIAYGLPVIGTTGGAIPEAVPSEASVLVPPDDVSALASALRRVIGDEDIRRSLAESARRAAQSLSTWEESGHAFARILEALA